MNHHQTMAQLTEAMLSAQTLGELYALMEVYSYEEFMQIYNQLPPNQQEKINAICDRDSQIQLAAIPSVKTLSLEKDSEKFLKNS
jgi:hypothetical protein